MGEGVALLSDQCIKLDEGYTAPTKAYLCTEQQNFKRTEKKIQIRMLVVMLRMVSYNKYINAVSSFELKLNWDSKG